MLGLVLEELGPANVDGRAGDFNDLVAAAAAAGSGGREEKDEELETAETGAAIPSLACLLIDRVDCGRKSALSIVGVVVGEMVSSCAMMMGERGEVPKKKGEEVENVKKSRPALFVCRQETTTCTRV